MTQFEYMLDHIEIDETQPHQSGMCSIILKGSFRITNPRDSILATDEEMGISITINQLAMRNKLANYIRDHFVLNNRNYKFDTLEPIKDKTPDGTISQGKDTVVTYTKDFSCNVTEELYEELLKVQDPLILT